MDDDLHVAALGDKLDIARIQARRLPIVCVCPFAVIISVPPLLLTRIFCPRESARLVSPPTE